jgi:hypothetical protein
MPFGRSKPKQSHVAGDDSLFPSPGNPGEGRVRVCSVDAIRQWNINGEDPHPNLLPEYREKEKSADRIAWVARP